MSVATTDIRAVGFIGLGDQGLPMATAVAEAGYELHVWARRPQSLQALSDTPHVAHDTVAELGAACDVVGLCVSTDDDVLRLASEELLHVMRPGAVIVNHGTGLPRNAVRLSALAAEHGVDALDAPVSGGRPAAAARTLTTLVGGPDDVVARCTPLFEAFAAHVVRSGDTGAGQLAKLVNNALLMVNQAAIADVVALGIEAGIDPVALVEGLKLGSATSAALTLLNTMVTPDTVDHLAGVEALDMEIFDEAMRDAGVAAEPTTERGLSGARRLPELIARLNP